MEQVYKYKLPNAIGAVEEKTAYNNSLIIIGANGSGKSKLGAWMEKNDRASIHRIGAQRVISWRADLPSKSFELLSNEFLYGGEHINESNVMHNYYGGKDGKTTTERNDVNAVLSAIFSKRTSQLEDFDERLKKADNQTLKREENIVDKIQNMWNIIFPHRQIIFKDMKIMAQYNGIEYNGVEMSDGERVALYLISQALLVPNKRTVIIDEPEIHLHRSIMNRLWTEIEEERQDCFFIYITHDTQFAVNHKHAKKIWVKSFDGKNWKLEDINESTLPEQLLLDILGNRKKVLFVEGDADSYDTKLYREIYKDYYVIPCGGCSTVIAQTKAMKNTPQLHELKCFGIIDRDFRSEHEINSLKNDDIFTLNVAEVENLFFVEELLEVVNTILAKENETSIDNVKKYVIEDRFSKEINKQILEATVSEAKYQLSIIDIPKNDENEAKQKLADLKTNIDFDKIKSAQETKYNDVLKAKDYKKVLSVFNRKDVVKSIGHEFGLQDREYCDFVIRQLQGDKSQEIINSIKPYLPTEIKND
jgi:ABC-type cobalamin/Fe3+-siderophores transport system ATPase subunit